MKTTLAKDKLEHFGSLITIKGTNQCLGDLMFFDSIPNSQGVAVKNACFCPHNGQVPVTKDEATAHNAALDKARLDGMDENCQVGQGTMVYLTKGVVHFFSGTVVSSNVVAKTGRKYTTVTFSRNHKTFTGRMENDAQCFFAKRVA